MAARSSSKGVLLLLLLVILAAASTCAPASSKDIKSPWTKNDEKPWWCQPCNRHRTRHSRQLRVSLIDQFNMSLNTFQKITKKYMNTILPMIGNITTIKNKWLPQKSYYKKLRRDPHTKKFLIKLYNNTLLFAATIQKLIEVKFRFTPHVFVDLRRDSNFTTVKDIINLIRCELEDELYEYNMQHRIVETYSPDFDKTIDIPSSYSTSTEVLMRDYSVLRDYGMFLRRARKALIAPKKKNNKLGGKKRKNGRRRKQHQKSAKLLRNKLQISDETMESYSNSRSDYSGSFGN